ncbi:S-type pyocin family protein [uncultured Brevundimonas sp.]|uniref:S-type pyocin family protein n=1 Tax=uncultured Brevundimonas sp. TaxID=213418 RepID=UPI0030ECADC5|tara:strand:+ start:693 stop:1208 length:516 start_codon:yes stop_codon:yes gene_type:complete
MARNPVAMSGMIVAGLVMLVGPGGCDNAGSAVETRDRTAETGAPVDGGPAAASTAAASPALQRPPVTTSRRETVDAKVERLFQRNGAAFGARSSADYLAKMQAFVDHPPRAVETVHRPNGDVLYYEVATNTFAVATRDGTPRTMFKPDDGAAYWAEQKARAPDFGRARPDG